jgi:hypothetical protein
LQKKIRFSLILLISATTFLSCNRSAVVSNHNESSQGMGKDYVKDEVIVKFKQGVSTERINEINNAIGCEIIKNIGPTNTFLLKILHGNSVNEIINKYKLFNEVDYAQPNYIYRIKKKK